ncbi:MAG: glycosyltransferase family 2 protein [Nitrospirae bacterium]|nr:glycosyltransferase family 2 protein [Nitrospirota bacterium]
MPLISVIIPVLNEEQNIGPLCERLSNMANNSAHTFEFIFVDDGSTDDAFSLLSKISKEDTRFKIIKFSRNFGSHAACLAGLMSAKGDASAFISADLQEPPELILTLIKEWEKGSEVVMGLREGEENLHGLFAKAYYLLVRRFALKNYPQKGTDIFLIDRKVVDAVTRMKEKNTSIVGLLLWCGFRQSFVPYERRQRQKGVSKWTLGKKMKLFIDTFVSFSYFPIRLISGIGVLMSVIGFLYASIIVLNRLLFSNPIEGWASLMVVLLVVSGIQLLMLGMLGEYLWRSFDETRNRPPFIIDQRLGFDKTKGDED